MPATKALAIWGSSALVVATGAVGAVVLSGDTVPAAASSVSGGSSSAANQAGDKKGSDKRKPAPGKALRVTATAPVDLTPGQEAELIVNVTNPNAQPVKLTSVTAAIDSVAPSSCSKSWFTIAPSYAPIVIAAGATESVPLDFGLDDLPVTNQDACKSATYSFSFTATGQQA